MATTSNSAIYQQILERLTFMDANISELKQTVKSVEERVRRIETNDARDQSVTAAKLDTLENRVSAVEKDVCALEKLVGEQQLGDVKTQVISLVITWVGRIALGAVILWAVQRYLEGL